MLPESILGAGFDGVVASAGAYVEVAGEVLVDSISRPIWRPGPWQPWTRTTPSTSWKPRTPSTCRRLPRQGCARIVEAHFASAPEGRPTGSSAILGGLTTLQPGSRRCLRQDLRV